MICTQTLIARQTPRPIADALRPRHPGNTAQLLVQIEQYQPCVDENNDDKNSNASPNQMDHSKALQLRTAAAQAINTDPLSFHLLQPKQTKLYVTLRQPFRRYAAGSAGRIQIKWSHVKRVHWVLRFCEVQSQPLNITSRHRHRRSCCGTCHVGATVKLPVRLA